LLPLLVDGVMVVLRKSAVQ